MKNTAIVTGGTRGIGRAITKRLAQHGFRVVALYGENREAAEELEAEGKASGLEISTIRGDLGREKSASRVLAELRETLLAVHCLVHSAASGVHRDAEQLTLPHFQFTFGINVFSLHFLVTGLLDRIPAGGRIIGITSDGTVRAVPAYAAIGASKGALEALFLYYAKEFASRGISSNLIRPGMVLTEALDSFPDREARIERCLRETPTGRMTSPEDVAEVAHFLATSRAAGQMQGQIIAVDGGRWLST